MDNSFLYFPSCNFTKASPEAARRLQAYLSQAMPVAGCCRVDKTAVTQDTTAVYFCQACREVLEARQENRPSTQNLFVYLDSLPDFPWPDYSSLTVNLQDCWRDRDHPEIADAARSLLKKMGVTLVEMAENREGSVYCGNLHFEPRKPESLALLAPYPDTPLYRLPEDIQAALMREQLEKYTCPLVATTCNRCTRGIEMAGGRAVHLVELVTGAYQP